MAKGYHLREEKLSPANIFESWDCTVFLVEELLRIVFGILMNVAWNKKLASDWKTESIYLFCISEEVHYRPKVTAKQSSQWNFYFFIRCGNPQRLFYETARVNASVNNNTQKIKETLCNSPLSKLQTVTEIATSKNFCLPLQFYSVIPLFSESPKYPLKEKDTFCKKIFPLGICLSPCSAHRLKTGCIYMLLLYICIWLYMLLYVWSHKIHKFVSS